MKHSLNKNIFNIRNIRNSLVCTGLFSLTLLVSLSSNSFKVKADSNQKYNVTLSNSSENNTELYNPYYIASNYKNITNVDGFLTPDTWYQPKKVMTKKGQYRNSTSKDLRPLLSVWWPNKQVEVNYINYMNNLKLGTTKVDINTNQKDLNYAANKIHQNIDKKISNQHNSTYWLRRDLTRFIKEQPEWNITSEQPFGKDGGQWGPDGYQYGTIKYGNNKLTPYANSNYRLLKRNEGDEFLLANDVDNSNPTVQAESLNWMYYLTHFSSILNDGFSGNTDGFRVDAVDDVDNDILEILSQYMNSVYRVNKSEKDAMNHLSILEDWNSNDPVNLVQNKKDSDQLTVDSTMLKSLDSSLYQKPNNRNDMNVLINGSVVNRSKDYKYNSSIPNYSIVRAHDTHEQDQIFQILNDKFSNKNISSKQKLKDAVEYYKKDIYSTNKQYAQYNIPLAYALTLTNKDTVPRIYYGDMYFTGGQFMQTKTPYFNSISTMLKGRIKYVSGGQQMNVQNVNGNQQVLTSVRFGKGALTPNSLGNPLTRTSGIGVVESNNSDLSLNDNDKVILDMGAAHKDQEYRPLLNSESNGIANYSTDNSTKIRLKTNGQGQLVLTNKEIHAYSNPQVSGYLSMWVPVGAKNNQDVRTSPSDKPNANGRVLNSNAALDSNVFYEIFSSFQAQPKSHNEYENVILPKKVKLFKNWGVTYMHLPPQYRSTNGDSFLDEEVHNGYAFNDRYDLGFKKPTKYGTDKEFINTVKAFHGVGIKSFADIVFNQLYRLPKQEVVTGTRSDNNGNTHEDYQFFNTKFNINNTLYLANTMGSGHDYQFKYGGKFLPLLEKKYPKLFKVKMSSTGKPIDPAVKIKIWSAKYMNGTKLQGNGAFAVLSGPNRNEPYMVKNKINSKSKINLPSNLLNHN